MQSSCIGSNEHLAFYLENTSPGRFPDFCRALRQYPLPIVSASSATALRGSSREALLAVDAYFASLLPSRPTSAGEPRVGVGPFPRPDSPPPIAPQPLTGPMPSPFRHFAKLRRLEAPPSAGGLLAWLGASPRRAERTAADDSGLRVRELRAKCAALGLLTGGTKRDLLARLRQGAAPRPPLPPQSSPPPPPASPPRPALATGTSTGTVAGALVTSLEESLQHSQRLRTPFRSPTPEPAAQRAEAATRRPVGTPQEFVDAFLQRQREQQQQQQQQQQQPRRRRGADLSTAKAADGLEARRPWRLLVDNRERLRGAHEHVLEALGRAGLDVQSYALPCGDFMFMTTATRAEEPWKLIPVVVERKTVRDLCASIAGSRYYEQRRLLAASPFRSVVWLVEGITDSLRPDEQRRVASACASLAMLPRFRVVRTRHVMESIMFLKFFGIALSSSSSSSSLFFANGEFSLMSDYESCLEHMARLKQSMRALTTFPRMLMCLRGCSSALAVGFAVKYGSMLRLWRLLRDRGREACDADEDIQRLSSIQKEVYVRLTEFLLAEEYC